MITTIESNVPVRPVFETPGAVTRWNPIEEFPLFRHRMEDLFSRAFGYTPLSRLIPNEPFIYEPAVDIYEKTDVVELFAALPGFTVDMIKVEATPEYIVLIGERKPVYEDKVPIFRQGFVTAPWNFTLNVALPCEIEPNGVKAVFSNGVLHITMRKSEKALVHNVPIPVTPV